MRGCDAIGIQKRDRQDIGSQDFSCSDWLVLLILYPVLYRPPYSIVFFRMVLLLFSRDPNPTIVFATPNSHADRDLVQ